LGLLLVAAGFSGLTAPIGNTGVRLEQPAIALLALLIVAREPRLLSTSVRRVWLPAALILVCLGANVVAAILYAPDVLQSLKVTLWLGVSIVGGLIALLLLTGSNGRPGATFHQWIIGTALVSTAVATLQVTAEALVGSTWGVLPYDTPLGKASGLAWEPNLLSIYLAMALSFVLFPPAATSITARWRWFSVVALGIGMALAFSRGGMVSLAVGVGIGLALVASEGARRPQLARVIVPALVALTIAATGVAGLAWLGQRGVGTHLRAPALDASATLPPLATAAPMPPAGGGGKAIIEAPVASPSPRTDIVLDDDTVGLRVRNLLTAWSDGLRSPVLGLGPDTFGQRYVEPTCHCPAHLPNQLSATFYETGAVGLVSLLAAFAMVVMAAIRAGRTDVAVALIVLAVGYQFTDAIRFATLWLLMGIGLGAYLTGPRGESAIIEWPFGRPRPSRQRTSPR
jgi:hypothetical protein